MNVYTFTVESQYKYLVFAKTREDAEDMLKENLVGKDYAGDWKSSYRPTCKEHGKPTKPYCSFIASS